MDAPTLSSSGQLLVPPMFFGLSVLGLAVARSDLKHRRIPNDYLLGGLLYAVAVILFFTVPGGWTLTLQALGFAFLGLLLGAGLMAPALIWRQVAPGDVKFMMVIGFFLGPFGVIFALLNAALIGGVWALVLAARHGGLGQVFSNLKFMGRSLWLSGFSRMGWDLSSAGALRMPYGVALAGGAWLVIAWQLGKHPVVRATLGLDGG